MKSITGTGVVNRYYEYGINSDGTQWTMVHTGSSSGAMWEKSTTDPAGRVILVEKPGFSGTVETVSNLYNEKGQLVKTERSGSADTIFEYNEIGEQIRSGLDTDSSGSLVNASMDRITETDSSYAKEDGVWWQKSSQKIYASDNSGDAVTVSVVKNRLTGLGDTLAGETIQTDIYGNLTTTSVYLDRSGGTKRVIVDYPDSNTDGERIEFKGLVQSVKDKTGQTMTYGYDALGRKVSETDPRTGISTTVYNDKNQVLSVSDSAGNTTTYGYDSATGRKISETDALSRAVYYKYDTLGDLPHTWGATPAVKYEFDDSGRMIRMHTWKTKDGWNSASWPDQNDSLSDVTTWNYEEATGLLLSKEDAEGKKVTYTYGAGGKLLTRTWARTSGSGSIGSIVTTYGYDDATGELTGINYSDDTPDITFSYNRAGSQTTITDALGTRHFTYNSSLQQISESMSGMLSASLTRSYDTLGRASGVSTGSQYSVTYGYGSDGRLSGLSWKAAGAQESAAYNYLAGSSLLSSVTFGNGAATNYTYEPQRNLKTEVKNLYGSTAISQYSYTYDAISRRTSMTTASDLFSATATTTTAAPDVEPDIELDLSQSGQIDYTSNSLNQYTEIDRDGKVSSPSYDDDGNMTEDGTRIFTWNGENRLVSAAPKIPADSDEKAEFVYD